MMTMMSRMIAIVHMDVVRFSIAVHLGVVQLTHCTLHIFVVDKLHNTIAMTNITIAHWTNATHIVL